MQTHDDKEKRFAIDPNSELRKICRMLGPSNGTQCQCLRVVRRFLVRDGIGRAPAQSIQPDATGHGVFK